jgi:hypothetical protein
MDLPADAVLVFDQSEDLCIFTSFMHAENWLEAVDVSEGEYPAAYTPDGGVVAATAPDGWKGPVLLARTDRVDRADLDGRVARYWRLHQVGQPPLDPVQTVGFLIDRDSRPRKGWSERFTS